MSHLPTSTLNHILAVTPCMPGYSSIVIPLLSIRRFDRRGFTRSTGFRRYSPIHTLNDDVLLDVFCLCEPPSGIRVEEEGDRIWVRRPMDYQNLHWWYKLAHVCRRWRYLILASSSRLRLHLLCQPLTPVANMITHSPPLPLAIECDGDELTAKEQEGMLYALQHCDRVRHIALEMSNATLQRLIMAMDKQFPILERLFIRSWGDNESMIFPETFQAPHLRYLVLWGAVPAGFPFTTTMNLVTLAFHDIPATASFSPSSLFTRLSLIPQLESLSISFDPHLINLLDVDSQLSNIQIMSQISTPLLKTPRINLLPQHPPLAVPHLLRFVSASENLAFRTVLLSFYYHSSIEGILTRERNYQPIRNLDRSGTLELAGRPRNADSWCTSPSTL
ncbi:hypothetical protein BJV78DRAFT_909243 [Lactifluus subvellereus]|nr:hypothetical protein BJV78DRAFT_909243 [Lactifluus subvellereus]